MPSFYARSKEPILIGHVSRIPLRIDLRWFPVLIILAVITILSINAVAHDVFLSTVLGLAGVALFFASIFLHELAHAAAARLENLQVVEIVLHPFGGLARFARAPQTPRAEFNIALAGPAASFVLALAFAGLTAAVNFAGMDILAMVLLLLAVSNFMLAAFNLFPGYPLDGGRVLRAYLWKSGKDLNDATRLTAYCGQVIAIGLGIIGIGLFFAGQYFAGAWMAAVAVFLFDAAATAVNELRRIEVTTVDAAMTLAHPVSPDATLQAVIDAHLPMAATSVLTVSLDRDFYGFLVLEDIKALPKSEWRSTLVRDAMRPLELDHFVELGTPIAEARALARSNKLGTLAVIDADGKLVGVLHAAAR